MMDRDGFWVALLAVIVIVGFAVAGAVPHRWQYGLVYPAGGAAVLVWAGLWQQRKHRQAR